MDGKVVIGTALDTQDLDKQLKFLQRQLTQYEKEAEKLATTKAKIQVDLQGYEEAKAQIQAMTDKSLEQAQTTEQVNWVLESEQMQLEELNQKYSKQFEQLSEIDKKIEDNGKEQEILKGKVQETTQALEKQKQTADMKDAINGVGKEMNGVINKVGKWGLAIFGIRSAYMLVRQAMSTLASEDDQLAADIEYIRWILAQTLKPIVDWLIGAVYYVISLLDEIFKRIAGINLLTGKSTEDFAEAKKNTGGMAKNLANAKKQLAGFDEMNVLSDSSSAGGGAGAMPSFPPKAKKDAEDTVNAWEQFGKEMEEALKLPLEKWFEAFGNWGLLVRGATETVHGLWEAVSGLVQFFVGVFTLLYGLFTGNKELIMKGLYNMIDGIWHIVDGLIKAIWGLVQMLAGLIVGIVLSLWDIISGFLSGIAEWIDKNVIQPVVNFVKGLWEKVKEFFVLGLAGVGLLASNAVNWLDKNIIKPVAKFFTDLWNGIINGVKNAVKWVKDTFNSIVGFFSGIINTIMGFFGAIGVNVGDAIGGAFKGVINSVLSWITNKINGFLRSINNAIDYINAIPLVNIPKLKMVSFPRLAKGGIINMPGRGVPVGSAIAGERGQEAVLPLTDSQQMALLGEAIGKYITINANITNTMNGRVISKELQKIQAENDFAYNR